MELLTEELKFPPEQKIRRLCSNAQQWLAALLALANVDDCMGFFFFFFDYSLFLSEFDNRPASSQTLKRLLVSSRLLLLVYLRDYLLSLVRYPAVICLFPCFFFGPLFSFQSLIRSLSALFLLNPDWIPYFSALTLLSHIRLYKLMHIMQTINRKVKHLPLPRRCCHFVLHMQRKN